jgi:hypothetical protein
LHARRGIEDRVRVEDLADELVELARFDRADDHP